MVLTFGQRRTALSAGASTQSYHQNQNQGGSEPKASSNRSITYILHHHCESFYLIYICVNLKEGKTEEKAKLFSFFCLI